MSCSAHAESLINFQIVQKLSKITMEDSYIATFWTVASITKVIESNILIIRGHRRGQAFILVSSCASVKGYQHLFHHSITTDESRCGGRVTYHRSVVWD